MCWNKGRLCWKIAKLFYFCHLKKLVRPETFGPYYVAYKTTRLVEISNYVHSMQDINPYTMNIKSSLKCPVVYCAAWKEGSLGGGGMDTTATCQGYFPSLWQFISLHRTKRPQFPRDLRPKSTAVRMLRLWVQMPPGAWMSVCCECCVLSGRGLCEGLITRLEGPYRLWCVVVFDLETSWMRRPWPTGGEGGGCCERNKHTETHNTHAINNTHPLGGDKEINTRKNIQKRK